MTGTNAHQAGLSLNDTATAIALMANAGIKGSDAGTSLKTMLQRLIPTTDKQRKVLSDLGGACSTRPGTCGHSVTSWASSPARSTS